MKKSGMNIYLTEAERADINKLSGHLAAKLEVDNVNQKDTVVKAVRFMLKMYETENAK